MSAPLRGASWASALALSLVVPRICLAADAERPSPAASSSVGRQAPATSPQDPDDVPPSDPAVRKDSAAGSSPPRRWYGWQTLLVDAPSLTLLEASVLSNDPWSLAAGLSGLAGYVAGAPIVHALHGRTATGAADAGLRIGIPLVGFLAGYAVAEAAMTSDCRHTWSCEVHIDAIGTGTGLVTGSAAAIAIDAAVLAYDRPPPKRDSSAWVVRPALAVGRQGVNATIGSVF